GRGVTRPPRASVIGVAATRGAHRTVSRSLLCWAHKRTTGGKPARAITGYRVAATRWQPEVAGGQATRDRAPGEGRRRGGGSSVARSEFPRDDDRAPRVSPNRGGGGSRRVRPGEPEASG